MTYSCSPVPAFETESDNCEKSTDARGFLFAFLSLRLTMDSGGQEPLRCRMPELGTGNCLGRRCVAIAILLCCALTDSVFSQTECLIYAESFDSFAGPRDLDDGTYFVQWCESGATVTSSSFCPTGNAFKLDAGGDDPIVFVAAPASACTSFTINFDYSQFADTATILRFAVTNDNSVNCSQFVSTGAVALTAVNGVCTPASHTVSVAAGQSVYWRFDHGNNTNAVFIDNVVVQVAGCCDDGSEHGCCEVGGAGCTDSVIEQCVCIVDPFCCDTKWDQLCVDQVESLSCGSCAPAPTCIGDFAIDFGTLFQSGSVCSMFPQLFQTCQGTGPFISSGTACGGSGDMAMTFASGFPYSAAITHCVDLTEAAVITLSFDYTKNTGTLGPRVDVSLDGETYTTIWQAAVVFTGDGCEIVALDLNVLAGEPQAKFRFSSGSSVSNGAAFDNIVLQSSDVATHDCCDVGGPGCDDAAVQTCVCAVDPFCCETEWDDLCVIGVEFYQCGDCGFCVEDYNADFGDTFVGGTVCDLFPEWFISCEGSGPWLTTGTDCGGAGDPVMLFGVGSDISAAYTRCLNLADLTQAALQFTYTKIDGTVGPVIDISQDAGGTFAELWRAPESPGDDCHDVCLDLSKFTGHPFVLFRVRAGAADAAGSAMDDIQLLRDSACPPPTQSPDIDGNGSVDVFDLLELLSAWGQCAPTLPCPADLDNSGAVDVFDLLELLGAWGTSP